MELIEGIFLSQTFTTTVACCLKHVLQGQSLYRKGYMNWQVSSLLQVVEEEIERSMDKMKSPVDGLYKNIFDGKVCKKLPRKDGSLFSPSDEIRESGELRIGVTLGGLVSNSIFLLH